MALDPKSVEPAYGFHKVQTIDAELAQAQQRVNELTVQRKLYEPASKRYVAEQKKRAREAGKQSGSEEPADD